MPATAATDDAFRNDARRGWMAWAVLLVFLSIVLAAVPERSGVTSVYREALRNWLAGRDLYNDSGHGFLYLPASVALYFPLLLKPPIIGEILWRCFTVGTFAWGTWRFSRLAAGWFGRPVFGILSVVGAILALPGGRNGQTTLPMAGLLMIAAAEAAAGRDGRVGLAAVGSLLLKPLSLPAMLLLAACRPRSIPLMLVGTLAVLAAPFLAPGHDWIWRQYGGFWNVLTLSEKMSSEAWATLAGAAAVFGTPLPDLLRTGLSLTAAAITLGGCLFAWRSLPPAEAATTMYSLAMLWIMLFSPRTENNTYACIAPTLGLAIAAGLHGVGPAGTGRSRSRAAVAMLVAAAVIGSYELGKLLVPGVRAVWLAPMATVFLILDTWWGLFVGRRLRADPPAG
jgi:hypothetical protein